MPAGAYQVSPAATQLGWVSPGAALFRNWVAGERQTYPSNVLPYLDLSPTSTFELDPVYFACGLFKNSFAIGAKPLAVFAKSPPATGITVAGFVATGVAGVPWQV